MRFLAYAASALVVLCSVIAVHAAPTDSVTGAFTNQTVTDLAPRDAASQPTCTRDRKVIPIWRFYYTITIPNIPITHDIPHVCDRLWKELKKHGHCTVSSPHGCHEEPNRTLKWHFNTYFACNSGMVQSAFWHGTSENLFGGLPKCK